MLRTELKELINKHLFVNAGKIDTVAKCLSRLGMIAKSHYISHHDEINLLIFAAVTAPPNYPYCLKYCEWLYANKKYIFEALKPLNDLENLEAIRFIVFSKSVTIYESGINTQTIANNPFGLIDPSDNKSHLIEASNVVFILKAVEGLRG